MAIIQNMIFVKLYEENRVFVIYHALLQILSPSLAHCKIFPKASFLQKLFEILPQEIIVITKIFTRNHIKSTTNFHSVSIFEGYIGICKFFLMIYKNNSKKLLYCWFSSFSYSSYEIQSYFKSYFGVECLNWCMAENTVAAYGLWMTLLNDLGYFKCKLNMCH